MKALFQTSVHLLLVSSGLCFVPCAKMLDLRARSPPRTAPARMQVDVLQLATTQASNPALPFSAYLLVFCVATTSHLLASDPYPIAFLTQGGSIRPQQLGISLDVLRSEDNTPHAGCTMIPTPASAFHEQRDELDWWVCKDLPPGTIMEGSAECVDTFLDGENVVACAF